MNKASLVPVLLFLCASCTSWSHVPRTADLTEVFELGDLARVEQQDGTRTEIKVTEVGPNHLGGGGAVFQQGELVSLKSEKLDSLKTVGAVAGSAVTLYVAAGTLLFTLLILSL